MQEGQRVDAELRHQWMRLSSLTIVVELSLEECINSGVDVEREAARTADAEPFIEVETARALMEKIEPAPGELEWPPRGWGIATLRHVELF